MVDMNMFAAGYGPQSMPQQPQNPMAGAQQPQQAKNMPGAVGNIVQSLMSNYEKGQASRRANPALDPHLGPSPDFPMETTRPVPGAPGLPPGLGAPKEAGSFGGMPATALPMMGAPVPFPGLGGLPPDLPTSLPGGIMPPPGGGVPFPGAGGMGFLDMMQNQGMPTGGLGSIFGGFGG